jgi:hypothetical protein
MRSKSFLPAILAVLLTAATATAQTISYINFLQFDLQSFRSQATAGIFQDDVDMVSDAANLTSIEGNRLFTNFANLSDPALLGDNILTYSADHLGIPSTSDNFDDGSYLVGWIGKYNQESDYNFEVFYQRNGSKSMFEDLEDFNLGFLGSDFDAQYDGSIRSTTHDDSTGAVLADNTQTFDLERYDERTAMDVDLGAARDLSEELTIGGRFFWENDQLDSFANGTYESANRVADSTGALIPTTRSVSTWIGNGEEAFKNREIGVSLDADYHPWENQDINVRLDVFGTKLVNPSSFSFSPGIASGQRGYFELIGERVTLRENTSFTRVAAGTATAGQTDLASDRENTSFTTDWYSPYPNYYYPRGGGANAAVESVDDERTGIGFAAKGQWDREWAGGENRLWLGFGHRGLDIDATVVEVERNGTTFWWNGGSGDREAIQTNFDRTETSTASGDMSLNVIEVGTRWSRDMNEHVSMGLGAILTRETWTEEFQAVQETYDIEDAFDDGDPGTNALYTASNNNAAYNEDMLVYENTDTADVNDESRTTMIRLPVGAQFHFLDRWTVNVGAQHTIYDYENELAVTQPEGGNDPGTFTYTDIGGQGTAPSPNPDYDTSATPFSADETIVDKFGENWTTYWYGLSVMITDAAQLDINGIFETYSISDRGFSGPQIFDTDFFRSLAISLKYIFW